MRLALTVLAICLFCVFCVAAYADESATTLKGTIYGFHESVEGIFKQLYEEDKQLSQDKFEASKAFNERIANLLSEKKKPLLFYINTYEHDFTYNADKEEFTFRSSYYQRDEEISGKERECLKFDLYTAKGMEDNGEYIGQNAFGVKKLVKKEDEKQYNLIIPVAKLDNRLFKKDGYEYKLNINFKCNVEKAKTIALNLGIYMEVMPVLQHGTYEGKEYYYYIAHRLNFRSPTISDPVEGRIDIYNLCGELNKIYIADRFTHEIYATFTNNIAVPNKSKKKKK